MLLRFSPTYMVEGEAAAHATTAEPHQEKHKPVGRPRLYEDGGRKESTGKRGSFTNEIKLRASRSSLSRRATKRIPDTFVNRAFHGVALYEFVQGRETCYSGGHSKAKAKHARSRTRHFKLHAQGKRRCFCNWLGCLLTVGK